jgi:hypothetical protein
MISSRPADDDDSAEVEWRGIPERCGGRRPPSGVRQFAVNLPPGQHREALRKFHELSRALGTTTDADTLAAIIDRAHGRLPRRRATSARPPKRWARGLVFDAVTRHALDHRRADKFTNGDRDES